MKTAEELIASVPTGLWHRGASAPSESGRTFEVLNPATGTVLAEVAGVVTEVSVVVGDVIQAGDLIAIIGD